MTKHMNKNFAFFLSCAVTVLGLASCSNKETDFMKPEEKTHTVVFNAQTPAAEETKTALHLQVIPDWRNTDVDDVHIFETETTSGGSYMMEASKVYMETPIDGNVSKARFTAEFDNATVIVNPPVMAETKASSSQFNYTAIMATREGDKYVIPSVQYPHEESLIDPKADFLVGRNDETYSQSLHEQQVGLDFLRPVALARLAITNLEGTKVTKVKMTTVTPITGYVTYDEVDFENKTCTFNGDESNKELTLLFPEGKKRTTTFYAYFVCVPGKAQFSKVEVYTDQYVFTKTYATPGSVTFTAGDFMNIALDMTVKEDNGVSRSELAAQTLTFINADEEPVTEVEFDLYTDGSAEDFILPTLVCEGVVDETLVTVTSSNEDVATVDEDGYVHLTGAIGEATITASVPGDDTHSAGTASYKITVTDSTPAPEAPKYYKAEELVDGQEYIIVSGGKAMTLVETKASSFTLGAVDVEAVDGVIETDEEKLAVWTASTHVEYYEGTSEAGHFTLKSGDVYLQRHSNQSEQTAIAGDIPSTGKYYVWDYDGEYLSHVSSSSNTFYMGYADNEWKFNYQTPYYKATLYTTTKPLTKQTLSFGEEPVTAKYDLNGGEWTVAVPKLTGAQTEVTYSSSNDAIEVDASTGAINITDDAKKGDKATITATAAQSEEYASAKATYTIEIIDSSEPQPTGTTYYLVAKQEDVVEGTYLIVSAADAYVFDGTGTYQGGYATIADAENMAFDSDAKTITINGATDAFDFAFAKSGDGFTITGEKGMIVAAEHNGASTSEETYITFAETGGSVFLQRGSLENKPEALLFSTTRGTSSNEYLYYHTTNKIFKIGGSGSSNGIHLYFAGERAAQTVSFASEAFTYDLAGEGSWSPSVPAVSGTYNTELVYASSNENVIKYDEDNGWIFGTAAKKNATATITVTAPASDQYLSASASFTVTIVDSTPSTAATYYKADEIEAGKEYLIVSNGYALRNNDGALAAVEAGTGDSFQFEEESTDLWTATADGDAFTLTNNSKYLRRSGSSYSVSLSIGSASSTAANNQWTYDAENNYVMSGTYYLYYSTSNSTFSISTTKSDTHIAALYSTTAPLPAWEISFSADAAEYDIFTNKWSLEKPQPTLTSATTNVTYASSNEDVATVSSTGNVEVLASGTTIITATAVADETHKKAVASYTLTVVNSDPDLPKYTKVTSTSDLTAGAKYLIVFEGLANDPDDGDPMVFKAILNTDGTQFAKATTSAQPVTIANGTIASDALGDYQFTLSTGYYLKADKADKYIYPGTSGSSSVMLAESTASHALTITFNNGIAEIKNGSRYLVWSISSHYFSSNSEISGQYSTGICLYKLEGSGGSTPEPPTPSTNPTYTLIEGDANLETGTYVIAEKTNTYLFNASGNNNGGYSTIGTTTGVTISGSTITLTSDIAKAHEFVITRTEDNLTIKQVGGTHEGQYMFATASVSNTYIGFQASAATFVLNKQTNTNLIYFKTTKGDSDSEYLYKKSTDSFFKLGGSGAPGGSDAGVLLYKKNSTSN